MALIKCPECEKEISDMAVACPNCGYSLKPITTPVIHNKLSEEKRKKLGIIVAIVTVFLIAIITGIWVQQNVLFGDEKIAYDIMVACADNFKDPGSLRLVSGRVGTNKNCLFVRIKAKNSYGAYNTADYFFHEEGWVVKEYDSEYTNLYEDKDLDFDKINRIYEKNYG